jgi:hypothetical protein
MARLDLKISRESRAGLERLFPQFEKGVNKRRVERINIRIARSTIMRSTIPSQKLKLAMETVKVGQDREKLVNVG